MISSVQIIPMELETLQKTLKNINSLFHDHRGHCNPSKAQQIVGQIHLLVCRGDQAAGALAGGDKSTAEIPCGQSDRPTLYLIRPTFIPGDQSAMTHMQSDAEEPEVRNHMRRRQRAQLQARSTSSHRRSRPLRKFP